MSPLVVWKKKAQNANIGEGVYEKQMLSTLMQSSYSGDYGVIDLRKTEDSETIIKMNIDLLKAMSQEIVEELKQ